ncbi:hypothetical protein BJ742DRAFT_831980 [Cladochytrium replicatum]|nr:hypothetical protein BJ742DRAFT_831980 [Cladochytrium replicatum]
MASFRAQTTDLLSAFTDSALSLLSNTAMRSSNQTGLIVDDDDDDDEWQIVDYRDMHSTQPQKPHHSRHSQPESMVITVDADYGDVLDVQTLKTKSIHIPVSIPWKSSSLSHQKDFASLSYEHQKEQTSISVSKPTDPTRFLSVQSHQWKQQFSEEVHEDLPGSMVVGSDSEISDSDLSESDFEEESEEDRNEQRVLMDVAIAPTLSD